jgi:hypothetical protein
MDAHNLITKSKPTFLDLFRIIMIDIFERNSDDEMMSKNSFPCTMGTSRELLVSRTENAVLLSFRLGPEAVKSFGEL